MIKQIVLSIMLLGLYQMNTFAYSPIDILTVQDSTTIEEVLEEGKNFTAQERRQLLANLDQITTNTEDNLDKLSNIAYYAEKFAKNENNHEIKAFYATAVAKCRIKLILAEPDGFSAALIKSQRGVRQILETQSLNSPSTQAIVESLIKNQYLHPAKKRKILKETTFK